MMLARALLQSSLLLWLAQQTLQGGLKPQSVAYGRMLPNRGVGHGVKPGAVGALGAVGNRYNTKAMKTGLGRYGGAQLGVGGYRSLGLGGRSGLKPGYGTQGGYGASLGTGMVSPGLTNGLGLGLGQTGKRGYGTALGTGLGTNLGTGLGGGLGTGLGTGVGTGLGTGLGALPGGYGALGGVGVPGARQGPVVSPDLRLHGGLKGAKGRGQTPYVLNPVRSNIQHPSTLEIQTDTRIRPAGGDIRGLEVSRSTNIGAPIDKPGKSLGMAGQGREDYLPITQRGVSANQGLTTGRLLQSQGIDKDIRNLPTPQIAREVPILPNQKPGKNCNKGLSDQLGIIQQSELLRSQGLGSQFPIDKSTKYHGHTALQAQDESLPNFQQPLVLPESMRGGVFSLSQHQGQGLPSDAIRDLGLVGKSTDKLQVPQTHISIGIESSHRAPNLHIQGVEGNRQAVPGGLPGGLPGAGGPAGGASANLGLSLAEEQKSISKEGKHLFHEGRDVREPKALPGSTGANTQGPSYLGGQGQYLGASLGAGGYGTGLGQGGYLGGAAGKLAAGYGDGMTGYLGAMGGNGFGGDVRALAPGYANGFGDGYGAGHDFPTELTDVPDKTGKSKALSTGVFPGQLPGAGYGALGTGLESTGGKYGGAAQLPYGGAPVIPTGLEGEGGYPYTQPLSLEAEGAKAAKHYGDQTGKFTGGSAGLVNGYKG